MDLIVEDQEENRTHLFGVQDFQIDNSGDVVVTWPIELQTDETNIEGDIVAGGETADVDTYYEMMLDALIEDQDVVVANLGSHTEEGKVYNEIVKGIEKEELSVGKEKLDKINLVE